MYNGQDRANKQLLGGPSAYAGEMKGEQGESTIKEEVPRVALWDTVKKRKLVGRSAPKAYSLTISPFPHSLSIFPQCQTLSYVYHVKSSPARSAMSNVTCKNIHIVRCTLARIHSSHPLNLHSILYCTAM